MSDDRWTHTNWYATRLHIFDYTLSKRGYRQRPQDVSLCGHYVESIAAHSAGRSEASYSKLPHCKLCERKANKA
jgi:hypothetical protein